MSLLRGAPAAVWLILLVLVSTGCSGESDDPLIATSPEPTGTLSDETARSQAVQDVVGLRNAVEATGFGVAVTGIYQLLNDASEADVDAGGRSSGNCLR